MTQNEDLLVVPKGKPISDASFSRPFDSVRSQSSAMDKPKSSNNRDKTSKVNLVESYNGERNQFYSFANDQLDGS